MIYVTPRKQVSPLNVSEALKVFGITASRTSQVRCQNSLRFWVWLLNMLESILTKWAIYPLL